MRTRVFRRALVFSLLLTLLAVVGQPAALSVSKSQVDEACAASQAQYAEYLEARQRFEQAAIEHEGILNEIEVTNRKRDRVSSTLDQRQASMADVQDRIEEQAIQLYMKGGSTDSFVFFADSVDELITGTEFLAATSESDLGSLDDLLSLRTDMETFETELTDLDAQLQDAEAEAEAKVEEVLDLAEEQKAAYSTLSAECQELQAKYEAEQAAAAARAKAAQSGGGSGSGGVGAINGFYCPFPGSSFIDSWGYPRSGGRRHQGVDMMGGYGNPIIAVASGTVSIGNGGLGGRTIWLSGSGYGFYYAHLSSWAVSNGQSVSAGQVIGYNGDSGNAAGGSPHLHFEIHPGGRGASAVNPYPTVAAACR